VPKARAEALTLPGGTFFFTATLDDRRSSALVEHVTLPRAAFRKARKERLFAIDAIVILHPGYKRYGRKPGASCPVRVTYSV
jgi:REP element-mobilizing transposase RayT